MTFRFKLNKRAMTPEEIAVVIADKASQRVKRQVKLIDEWIGTNSDFDLSTHIQLWENYRKKYGTELLNECLKTMAIANSVVDVNSILERRMDMKGVAIDINEFNEILGKLFVVNLTQAIVTDMTLQDRVKEEILVRCVAKQFPNKENKRSAPIEMPKVFQSIEQTDEPLDLG